MRVFAADARAARISPPLSGLGLGSSMGVALPGYRMKVVDAAGRTVPRGTVGELVVRGPGVLKGYHGDRAATAAAFTDDGWLRTGDFARRGSHGVVHFEGRMKDVIKRGGYSVYSVEVEQALPQRLVAHVRSAASTTAEVRLRPSASASQTAASTTAEVRLRHSPPPHRMT